MTHCQRQFGSADQLLAAKTKIDCFCTLFVYFVLFVIDLTAFCYLII